MRYSRAHRRNSTTAIVATLVWLCAIFVSSAAQANNRPNVLLILIDDLGYADMSSTGVADDVATPHMDRLLAEGVSFSQAYATSPICNASRIALVTGRYQQRSGTFWYRSDGIPDDGRPTLAEVFRDHGYATALIGKFHYGGADKPSARSFPLNHGFDTLFGFAGGTKHYLRHKETFIPKNVNNDLLHQGPMFRGDRKVDVDGFTTELFGKEAREFIEKRNDAQPFFLFLSFNAVHNYTHQLPKAYLEEHGLNAFPDWQPGEEDYWDWRKRIGYPAHPHGRDYYLGQLHLLDREIGRILELLETENLLEETIVVFSSDNGGSLVTYADNAPLQGGKYTLFEGGIRVPLAIRLPSKRQAGTVIDTPASHLDLIPTLCRLANIETPDGLDGEDLTPTMNRSTEGNEARELYWDTGHQQAIRSGKWKLLVTSETPNDRLQIVDTPKGTFLYDLDQDPGESHDLADEHPKIVQTLNAKLPDWP